MSTPPSRERGRARPPATLPPAFPRPADVIRDLTTLLRGYGLDHLYSSACALLAILSIAPGLTVWTDGQHLTWTHHGTPGGLPARDTHHAAEHLAHLAHQPAAGPATPPGGNTS